MPEGWLRVPSPFPQSCLCSFPFSKARPSPFQLLPCTQGGCPGPLRTHRARSATNPFSTPRDRDAVRAMSPSACLWSRDLSSSEGCGWRGSSGTSHPGWILPILCSNPWKKRCLSGFAAPWGRGCAGCPRVGDEGLALPSGAAPRCRAQLERAQLFPFRLPAPGIPDGLHKAGNVSNGLRLMALHPRLSLKILSGGRLGWNGSRSRRAALGNLLRCQPRGAGGMEVPGNRDVNVAPGMHSPEKPLQPCLAGQRAPQTFSVPSNLF